VTGGVGPSDGSQAFGFVEFRTRILRRRQLEWAFKNNVMWDADVTWRARPGTRLYGEIAVDDVSFSSEQLQPGAASALDRLADRGPHPLAARQ
jgi:hypothetical protein